MIKTKKELLRLVKRQAKTLQKKIVFPEALEERTLRALEVILREKTAKPVLIGNKAAIQKKSKKLDLKINFGGVEFLGDQDKNLRKKYAEALFNLRKDKGLSRQEANNLLKDPNYFGVMAVHLNDADGMISGSVGETASTIRPALQILKTKEKFHKVSGVFFMLLKKRLLLFADCAVNIEPNSHDLADIAIDTAETAKRFGINPKIAILSFSTRPERSVGPSHQVSGGLSFMSSNKHPLTEKVREAVQIVKDRCPELLIEGEMQVDAAIMPSVAQRKCPQSQIKGRANVLIFPDLQSGNIAYKLVERLAGAEAVGPILQGLRKPVNDLSRGCSYRDIADLTAFTACEADETQYYF